MYEELIQRLEHAAGGPEGIKMAHDAAAAIAALQAENAELKKELIKQTALAQNGASAIDTNKRMADALSRVEAERDALVALINTSALKPIQECKHYKKCYQKAADEMHIMQCPACDHWEWRGVQGEG